MRRERIRRVALVLALALGVQPVPVAHAATITVTLSSLGDPYLTATATDARGTSEFSEVFTATETGGGTIYLPIALKNN